MFFFFFNDTATTEIYTLSLHDALPIYARGEARRGQRRGEWQPLALEPGHADQAEDAGVHEDDVGHDHVRGQARAELGGEVRGALGEAEVARDRSGHVPAGSLPGATRRD